MKILLIILIHFCIFSCSHEQEKVSEISNEFDHSSIDSLSENSNRNLKSKLDYSVNHLLKIITRNEDKIIDWESELMDADSTDSISIQIDINQMKNRVAIQKERLRRLKSKID